MDSSNINQQQSFFDLSNLNSLREEALQGDPDKKALKQVAAQFESIFTQMLFKSMRKANEAFEDESSPFNASSVKFYRDMHDQQLSMELSQSGALGLADIIVEQLSPTPGKYTPASLFTASEIAPQQKAMSQQKVTSSSSSLIREPSAVTESSTLTEAKNEPKAGTSFTDENSFVQGLL